MNDFLLHDGQTLLMQGDSITDAGRRAANAPYGGGYVAIFRELITALYPERGITIINRGISGHTTKDLKERWDDDAIRHQPDWLTLLIGINDVHRYLFNPDPNIKVSPTEFRENYDWLLDRTTKDTEARIVLLEPFYISRSNCDTNRKIVLDLLPEYIQVVHDMSEKYDTLLVKMHAVYQRQLEYREPEFFCPEPIHPSRGGHIVMAMELLRALGGV